MENNKWFGDLEEVSLAEQAGLEKKYLN